MTRDDHACDPGRACIHAHAVYVRNDMVDCIVGTSWTVKLALQCYFRFTRLLPFPFRTYKWKSIIRCIQKRCQLTVVVLLFTDATSNTRVLSHYYSNATRNITY